MISAECAESQQNIYLSLVLLVIQITLMVFLEGLLMWLEWLQQQGFNIKPSISTLISIFLLIQIQLMLLLVGSLVGLYISWQIIPYNYKIERRL